MANWVIERIKKYRCRCCGHCWIGQNCEVRCPKCGSGAIEESSI
jgi:rubrerythrin